MKSLTKIIAGLSLIAVTFAVAFYFYLKSWAQAEILISEPKVVELSKGGRLDRFSSEMASQNVIDSSFLFVSWVRIFSDYSKFQAGKYRFEGNVSPIAVADTVISGKDYKPTVLEYTIPEGFTIKKFTDRLVAKGVGTRQEFRNLCYNKDFLSSLKIPAKSLEGYLYPATYYFSSMPTAKGAIEKAVQTFWEHLPEGYEDAAREKKLTLEKAVIFASLIEVETMQEDEKSLVSEVIWRRLKMGAPLAIDAAIIYGIEGYKGDIRAADLKNAKNPYNTRIHKGLPPTAISSPSESSLKAVLNPSNKGYIFYVLNADEPTKHIFSKTMAEHNMYVKKLVDKTKPKKKSAKPIKKKG